MSASGGASAGYGVIGVGAIAAAIVTGLCEGTADPPAIVLSPRSETRARALADRFASDSVAADNQAVAEACSVLLVCVRPQDAEIVLRPLRLPKACAVVSMMAGVSASRLCELLGERDSLARAIPLPTVARRASVTPVLPPTTESRSLFDALGGALLVENVEAFDALSAATATIAAHFRYLNAVARWAGAHGVPSDQAERYVASVFAGVAETLAKPSASLSDLAEAHATPGGINEQFLELLDAAGTFATVEHSLDAVLQRIAKTPPPP